MIGWREWRSTLPIWPRRSPTSISDRLWTSPNQIHTGHASSERMHWKLQLREEQGGRCLALLAVAVPKAGNAEDCRRGDWPDFRLTDGQIIQTSVNRLPRLACISWLRPFGY